MEIIKSIPNDFVIFVMVAVFSLLIGLEQRRHHAGGAGKGELFGTDRTYALIGILGFILYAVSPGNLWLFASGGLVVSFFLAIFYWKRIETHGKFGLTSIITVLITYSLAPLLYTKPVWVTVCVVTAVMVLIEMKEQLVELSGKFDNDDFIILAKFLAISGIVLPLLPHEPISEFIPISPFKFWMVVVVVSAVSYLSYILKKFVFPKDGMLITGFLGGLYSSTATTLVLARKSKEPDTALNQISSAIILATGMMFIRIYVLILIFNLPLAKVLALPFGILTALTLAVSRVVLKLARSGNNDAMDAGQNKNPLEFKTALVFAALFVLFAVITKFVLGSFGARGLDVLALVVGVTDIDPFLMSLFTGSYPIALSAIGKATLIAVSSNNLVKLVYAVVFGDKAIRKPVIAGFAVIIAASVGIIWVWL